MLVLKMGDVLSVKANQEDGVFYTSINFTGIRKGKVSLFKFPLKMMVNMF